MRTAITCIVLMMAATAAVFAGGAAEPAGETAADEVTIWVPAGRGAVDDWDTDPILAEVEEVTGTDITIENLDWGAFMDQLTASIAGGTLPDIAGVTSPGQRGVLEGWIADGVLAAFEGEVAAAAPNIVAQYETNPMLSEIKVDGKIYFQPVGWGDEMYPNMGLLHVRADLLEQFGMDTPDTFEQYFAYLEKARDEGYGRLIFAGAGGVGNAINAFAGAYGLPHTGWVPVDGGYGYYAIQPKMKDALLLFRRLLERDLVSPAAWETESEPRAPFISGDASSLIFNGGGHIGRIQNDMDLVGEGAQEYLLPAPRHESETRGYTAEPMFWGFSWLGGMSHNNPVAAARVLNFLVSAEGYRLTAIGVEGIDYEVQDGDIVLLPARHERGFPTEAGDTGAHPLATHIVSWLPQEWQNWQLLYGKGEDFRMWFDQMWENQGLYQTESYGVLTTTEEWNDFRATGDELVTRAFLAIVQADSESEASRLFDEFVEDWLDAGGAEAQASMSERLSEIYR